LKQQVDPTGAGNANWSFAVYFSNDPWINENPMVRDWLQSVRDWVQFRHSLGLLWCQSMPILIPERNPNA